MSLLNIGMSGLSASQSSLMTTGNNIANADTAGYSRQQTVQGSKASNQYGNVFIGSGTTLADVRRVYNSYLDAQLRTATSLNSDVAAYQGQISPIDQLLSDSGTGMTGALTKFFASVQNLNAKPTDEASRQLLLSDTRALSDRFNSVSSQLNTQNNDINGNLASMADQVNKLANTVAQLNQKISELSSNGGAMPNDLLDARNETVRQLSTFIKVDVSERGSSLDLYLGSGQPLVMGNTSASLKVEPSKNDPSRSALLLDRGSSTIDITSVTTGGEIGGLLRYRSEVLDPAMNELGRLALVIADQMNSQMAQGIDKNGEFGGNLFNDINSAKLISERSIASGSNSAGSGNLNVTIKDTGKLTTSDYEVTFTSATDYYVKRSDGTSMGAFSTNTTPAPVIDGFSLSLNGGAMSAGDSFKVTPTRNAASSIQTEMTDAKRIAISAPLKAEIGAGIKSSLSIAGQPSLVTPIDNYDAAAKLEMQTAIKNSGPVKVVFNAASGGSQTYDYFDAKGVKMGSGSIVPGQSNTLNLQITMRDASGNPITDGGTPPVNKTFAVQMTVAGSPNDGDNMSISVNGAGSSDNRNGLALAGLQTKQTVDTGSASKGITLVDAYGKLIENVGSKASQAKLDTAATGTILGNAKGARDSLSGVDLDEETGNLVKYQQYYTASSQIIKAAQETFSVLINSL
ncbi:flagellar hook-associated protein FlgK [Pseudomonas chlororaphis]|uniref:Flagellar hook-associated protein 1 n=1 Tax=Pseudomonas chlororaphis TaxID=587753 RepID=A0A1Q8EST8_9PSED|nr:flagellar hook-associated protein FlgK [Pseudomonas chlororaphis]OLF54852.1 flagellar hook-associated protein FlgK [Pseudomonas chlororaphis]